MACRLLLQLWQAIRPRMARNLQSCADAWAGADLEKGGITLSPELVVVPSDSVTGETNTSSPFIPSIPHIMGLSHPVTEIYSSLSGMLGSLLTVKDTEKDSSRVLALLLLQPDLHQNDIDMVLLALRSVG